MLPRRFSLLPAALLIAIGLLLPAGAGAAITVPPPAPVNPPPARLTKADITRIVGLARKQLRRKVAERRGNNVPRFRNGTGKIAPYSIRDQWCVAFGTWVWNKAGFKDYLGADIIWRSHGGKRLAVQVTDMSNWAKRTGHWSARARRGYLVAYDFSHIGVVTGANREGQAVWAIEGNKSDRVRKVRVPMENVTGYISPVALTPNQIVNAIANPDMPVPEPIAEDPESFAASSAGN